MKKTTLFLSAIAVLALASCNNGGQPASRESVPVTSEEVSKTSEATSIEESSEESSAPIETPLINVYNANSTLVGSYIGSSDSVPLATYHHRDFGGVPFVELNQFLDFFKNDIVKAPAVEKLGDHLYAVTHDNIDAMILETEADVLTIKRFDQLLQALTANNNGVSFDIASSNPAPNSLVHPSEKTKAFGEYRKEVYDLKDYHIDIAEQDDKVYLPFQFISNIMFRSLGADIIYNGSDYYLSSFTNMNEASCYTSSGTFFCKNVFYQPFEQPLEGESYRYVGIDPSVGEEDPSKYSIYVLKDDGSGAYFHGQSRDAAIDEDPQALLNWEKKEGNLYVGVRIKSPQTDDYVENPSYFLIRNDQLYFNAKQREQAIADFNYDLLRFEFDELYGLKEELAEKLSYVDFDSFVTDKGMKNDFRSLDTRVYDEALAKFTMLYIDDGHTRYTRRSIFSGVEEKDANALVNENLGPRYFGLLNKLQTYQGLRKEATPEGEEPTNNLFMEDETAVIRFDQFMHITLPLEKIPDGADAYPLSTVFGVSSPWGFDLCMDKIKANPAIKNIVIDLTCNGGGMVMTLPYLAAHFTADPTIYEHDASMGINREFHYQVDLNHNGIFGEKEDTYADQYQFYLLTSDFSFSCGSCLPTMAKTAGVPIIGKQSGGGACIVGAYADANGSTFNTSSPMQMCYYDENDKLINDDAGVPVDYELAEDSWYDLAKLNTFVKGLKNS